MGLILDSSVLIASERRKLDLSAFLLPLGDEPVAIAAITLSELLHGWHRAVDAKIKLKRGAFCEDVKRDYDIISFSQPQAGIHARIWADLEKAGTIVGDHDLQIGATALSLGYRVATLNTGEFERIPDLEVVKPPLL